jgi:uncharacterized RDD family membrane protein YckC
MRSPVRNAVQDDAGSLVSSTHCKDRGIALLLGLVAASILPNCALIVAGLAGHKAVYEAPRSFLIGEGRTLVEVGVAAGVIALLLALLSRSLLDAQPRARRATGVALVLLVLLQARLALDLDEDAVIGPALMCLVFLAMLGAVLWPSSALLSREEEAARGSTAEQEVGGLSLLSRRIAAFGIDGLLFLAFLAFQSTFDLMAGFRSDSIAAGYGTALAIVAFLIFQMEAIAAVGQTPGLLAMGLQVRRRGGGALSRIRALQRAALALLGLFPPLGLLLLWPCFQRSSNRGVHDNLAGAEVIWFSCRNEAALRGRSR